MSTNASAAARREVSGTPDVASRVAAGAPLQAASAEGRARLAAAGGIVGAIGASACCILPLVLLSVGVTGSWMSALTAFSPYQPIFIALAIGFLGWGHYLVSIKPRRACAEGAACARPLPGLLVRISLWGATALVALAIAWPWLAPYVAPWLLGL